LDLTTTGTGFQLIAEMKSGLLQYSDDGGQIRNVQHHTIPPPWLLLLSVRHRPRARCAWTAEQNLPVAKRHARQRGEMLVLQLEPKVFRIEHYRPSDVLHLVSDTVNALDEPA